MTTPIARRFAAFAWFGAGLATVIAGIAVGDADDAPCAAVIGFLFLGAATFLGTRQLRRPARLD